MEKRGILTEESHSDFDTSKKVAYVDAKGFAVAGKGEADKLAHPQPIFSGHKKLEWPAIPGYTWPAAN
jgi:hypothetical protein